MLKTSIEWAFDHFVDVNKMKCTDGKYYLADVAGAMNKIKLRKAVKPLGK